MFCRLIASAALAAMAVCAAPARAQQAETYPSQPIRLFITNPAGGLPDTVARIFGRALEQRLGKAVVVENRPGANGSVAVNAMLAAPADGYVFVVTDGAIWSVNPALYADNPYQEKDLKPVSLLARAPLFLSLHPKVPANTLAEFVAYAKANAGKLNYGSSGVGSIHHLSMVALADALKLDMTHVPFKGTGESVPALLGGHIEALFSAYPSLSGAAAAKQVKLVAANSGARSALAPELPSIAEMIPGYDYAPIVGVYAKTGTPDAIASKLAAEIAAVAREADTIQRLSVVGVEAVGGDGAAHLKALQAESDKLRPLLKLTGLVK